jgi:hypothetical protein
MGVLIGGGIGEAGGVGMDAGGGTGGGGGGGGGVNGGGGGGGGVESDGEFGSEGLVGSFMFRRRRGGERFCQVDIGASRWARLTAPMADLARASAPRASKG